MHGKYFSGRKGLDMLTDALLPFLVMIFLIFVVATIAFQGKSTGEGRITVESIKVMVSKAVIVPVPTGKTYTYDFDVEIAAEYTGKFEKGEYEIGIIPLVSVKGSVVRAAISGLSAPSAFFSVKLDDKKFSGAMRGSAKSKIPPVKEGFSGEIREHESFLIRSSEGGTFLIRLEALGSTVKTDCLDGVCIAKASCKNPEFFFECINFEDKFSLKPWKQCEDSGSYEDCKQEYPNKCKGYFYMQMGSIDCENRKVTGLRIEASGGEDFKGKESLDIIFWKKTDCVENILKEGKYALLQKECANDLLSRHTVKAD